MSSRKPFKASIFDVVCHECRAAIRRYANDESNILTSYENIVGLRSKAVTEVAKYSLYFLIAIIVSQSLNNAGNVSVKTSLVSVTVPKVYVLFLAASAWVTLIYKTLEAIQLMYQEETLKRFLGAKPYLNSMVLNLRGAQGAEMLSPVRSARPSSFKNGTVRKLYVLLGFSIAALMVPLAGGFFALILETIAALKGGTDAFLGKWIAISNLVAVSCSMRCP